MSNTLAWTSQCLFNLNYYYYYYLFFVCQFGIEIAIEGKRFWKKKSFLCYTATSYPAFQTLSGHFYPG
jgi:hypothetical protein